MDADNHAFVDFIVRRYKHATAVFQVPQRIRHGFALLLRHQHSVVAAGHIGFHGGVVVEHMAHQARAARHGHKFALEADQAAGGNMVFQAGAAVAVAFHIGQFATAAAEFFHHRALVVVRYVHGEVFVRLAFLAVDFTVHHAWFAHSQFIAFTAHVFQQNRQVQLAAAGHAEHVGIFRVFHAQGDVGEQFALQAVADLAAGHKLAFGAGQRAGVHHKVHGQGGFVHTQHRHAHRVVFVANGYADTDFVNTGNNHDVARFGFVLRHALQAFEAQKLVDAAGGDLLVVVHHRHLHARFDTAVQNAADTQAAGIVVVVQLRNLQLQRCVCIAAGWWRVFQNGFEQHAHIGFRAVFFQTRKAAQTGSIHNREIQLLVGRAQCVKQFEGLVDDPAGAGGRFVDFVNHDNGF